MTREIIEGIQTIEREKGIESGTLIEALEDALLAAYKKTPGATRHAAVELDQDTGDFRVFSIDLPGDIEERLVEEARERAIQALEQQEEETGERSHVLVTDEDLTIDSRTSPRRSSSARTSRPTTSVASLRRRRSRSSFSGSARRSAR